MHRCGGRGSPRSSRGRGSTTSRTASGRRGPIHPAAAIAALRKVFPRDGVVLVDSGAHRAFAGHYWESYAPRTYISATNLGPMGWAIPAAVGVQLAKPDRRVAVITGDGCMQMHGMEIQTAARYGLPIIYLVLNNGALGNVWLRAHQYGPLPAELTSIPDHDWAGFARALGAEGFTVSDPAELGEDLRAGAGIGQDGAHRRQGRQGLPDAGLRFRRRRARLVVPRIEALPMSVLEMDPSRLAPEARALFAAVSAKRKARGEGFGGPYIALLNHPELARRVEELGFYLKFDGVLPRTVYQFIVLSVAHATGAAFEWHDHVEHALAAGLPADVIDAVGAGQAQTRSLTFCSARSSRRPWHGSRSPTTSRRRRRRNGA